MRRLDDNAKQPPALSGSSKVSQETFLKVFQLTSDDVANPITDVLSEKHSELISCAISHIQIKQGGLSDPYFTQGEWEKVQSQQKSLLHDAEEIIQDVVDVVDGQDIDRGKRWLRTYSVSSLCGCTAHSDQEFYEDIGFSLIEIGSPLTDDSGYRLANTLITFILRVCNMKNLKIESARQGPITSVKYLLELPSGEMTLFTGLPPDFQVLQSYSFIERRLGKAVQREQRVRGVGEIQSPPGNTPAAKRAAIAQAGIYTIGQLAKMPEDLQVKRIATIILYKDLSAQVALASLDPAKASSTGSIGAVSYKLVGDVHGYPLNTPDGVQRFASVFIATLQTSMTSLN